MSELIACGSMDQASEGSHHASPTQNRPRKTLEPVACLYIVLFSHSSLVQINTEWPNIYYLTRYEDSKESQFNFQ